MTYSVQKCLYFWSGIDQFSLLRLHHYFVVLIQLLYFFRRGAAVQSEQKISELTFYLLYFKISFTFYRKKSLLDNAPNQVVGCVIQKRVVLYFVSDSSITSSIKMSHKCNTTNSNCFAAAVTNHAHSLMTKQKSILVVSINCSSMHIQLSFPMKHLLLFEVFFMHIFKPIFEC